MFGERMELRRNWELREEMRERESLANGRIERAFYDGYQSGQTAGIKEGESIGYERGWSEGYKAGLESITSRNLNE